ncbi:hypothetical protein QTN25_004195 [Entamoeba marina]
MDSYRGKKILTLSEMADKQLHPEKYKIKPKPVVQENISKDPKPPKSVGHSRNKTNKNKNQGQKKQQEKKQREELTEDEMLNKMLGIKQQRKSVDSPKVSAKKQIHNNKIVKTPDSRSIKKISTNSLQCTYKEDYNFSDDEDLGYAGILMEEENSRRQGKYEDDEELKKLKQHKHVESDDDYY